MEVAPHLLVAAWLPLAWQRSFSSDLFERLPQLQLISLGQTLSRPSTLMDELLQQAGFVLHGQKLKGVVELHGIANDVQAFLSSWTPSTESVEEEDPLADSEDPLADSEDSGEEPEKLPAGREHQKLDAEHYLRNKRCAVCPPLLRAADTLEQLLGMLLSGKQPEAHALAVGQAAGLGLRSATLRHLPLPKGKLHTVLGFMGDAICRQHRLWDQLLELLEPRPQHVHGCACSPVACWCTFPGGQPASCVDDLRVWAAKAADQEVLEQREMRQGQKDLVTARAMEVHCSNYVSSLHDLCRQQHGSQGTKLCKCCWAWKRSAMVRARARVCKQHWHAGVPALMAVTQRLAPGLDLEPGPAAAWVHRRAVRHTCHHFLRRSAQPSQRAQAVIKKSKRQGNRVRKWRTTSLEWKSRLDKHFSTSTDDAVLPERPARPPGFTLGRAVSTAPAPRPALCYGRTQDRRVFQDWKYRWVNLKATIQEITRGDLKSARKSQIPSRSTDAKIRRVRAS